jgi:type IV pilus assembly protein PilQ
MMGPSIVAAMAATLVYAGAGAVAPAWTVATPVAASAGVRTPDDPAVRGRVSQVAVNASAGGVEVTLTADATHTLRHFRVADPERLVLDIGGAILGVRPDAYDGQLRGPVRNVRLSQFRTDTVRVVIDLDGARRYRVERDGADIRILFDGPATSFARWSTAPAARDERRAAAGQLDTAVPVEPTAAVALPILPDATATAPSKPTVPSLAEQARENITATWPEAVLPVPSLVPSIAPSSLVPASEGAAFASTPNAPTFRRQAQPKPRITVSYDGTDIRDVIASFATFSGRTIVVGKDVSGAVTADISDKPWDVALQAILQAQGLAATEDAAGIITVDSYRNLAQNQALEPLVTQIIDVNYAKATVLRQTVQNLLARDCTGLTTMATGREMGMNMQPGQQGGQQGAVQGQGCVVRGSVTADSATNKLIITEVPSRLPEIVARLQELDIRTPQVAIKAKIIFVNRTGITDIGLAYDLGTGTKQFIQQLVPRIDPTTLVPVDTDGDGVPDSRGGGTPFQGPARIALGGNAIAGIANANNAIKPNALNLIYSTALGRYQLTAFLNALQTSSLADIQSEPSVTILNNRNAEIFVGQEIPIRVIDAGGQGTQGGMGGGGGGAAGGAGAMQPNAATFFPRAAVSKEEAGIKLSVTPQITNNRMVILNIKAENSSAELGATDVGVIFNRQRAESQVLVADGEAAVIGGLTVTENTRFRSGIPILMNLPFVGRLFSQNTSNETKRDLLILVTPHILDEGVTPPPGR